MHTVISGQELIRPLQHTGVGTLSLQYLGVHKGLSEGTAASGGCIFSNGSVSLLDTQVRWCIARRTSGNATLSGGGIHAAKNLTLEHGEIRDSKPVGATSGPLQGAGPLQGGGSWSGGMTTASGASTYSGNRIESGFGNSNTGGGALWTSGGLDLQDTTVRDNAFAALASAGFCVGGGIHAQAAATGSTQVLIRDSTIRGNSASNGNFAGGLCLEGAGLEAELECVLVLENTAATSFAGVYAVGIQSFTVRISTIADNVADTVNAGLAVKSTARVVIESSTISGNRAKNFAGVFIESVPELEIIQTTISDNWITGSGAHGAGLILSQTTLAGAIVRNSTISANRGQDLPSGSPSVGASGIGLWLGTGGNATLSSTIIADNHWDTVYGSGTRVIHFSDVDGSMSGGLTGTRNLIGTSSYTLPANNLWSNYPFLGPLQDNGGPTHTQLPLANSPALDAGLGNGLDWDQRGAPHVRIRGAGADIGAVESSFGGDELFRDGFESP